MPRKQRFKPSRKPKPIEQIPSDPNPQRPVEQQASQSALGADATPPASSPVTGDS